MVEEPELKLNKDDFGYFVDDEEIPDRPFLGKRYLTVDEALEAIEQRKKLLSKKAPSS